MEEESLRAGIQRIKFNCKRRGNITRLLDNACDQDVYMRVAKQLAGECYDVVKAYVCKRTVH